jgi:tetratricopeptide (TPR) repeat protein
MTVDAQFSQPAPVDSGPVKLAGDVPRPRYRRLLLCCVAVILLAGLGVGSVWLLQTRTRGQFQSRCEQAKREGLWAELRVAAEEWSDWDPADSRPRWLAAEAAQEQDEFQDLADCLGRIPPSDPNYAFALAEKANVEWTALNKPLLALQTSEQAVQLEPRLTDTHSRIISFYAMTGQRIAMLKAIRAALQANAEPREAYTYLIMADVLSFSNGSELNEKWIQSNPDEVRFKISLAVNTAMQLAMNQDTSPTPEIQELNLQAKQQLGWFLEKFPHDPVLLSYLMHQAYRTGDVQGMAGLLQSVDDSAAADHMVWVYRGWYHIQMQEYAEAEKSLQEAIRIHPLSPLAHHEYASLLRVQQRPELPREQRLATYGRDLRSEILLLPSAVDLTPVLLVKIQSYAESCGDPEAAAALAKRLEQ